MNKLLSNIEKNAIIGKVNSIRPKVILKLIEENFNEPVEMRLNVPSSEIGSLTTLEATMIISLLKLIKPSIIFEFGTFLGYSTSIFLKNSSKDCITYSIDLGDEIKDQYKSDNIDKNLVLNNDIVNDNFLRIVQSKKGPIYIKNETENKERLKLLYGDSLEISIDDLKLKEKVQFVFIDGGHTYNIVQSDTKKSFQMVNQGILVWHDYNSKIHGDVTKFVDELSKDNIIYHIENTMLAFCVISE
jgi:predicted O-methyltransferase YrrM